MSATPSPLLHLIELLLHLPGVGPKTAEKYAYSLASAPQSTLNEIAQSLSDLRNQLKECARCHTIALTDPCPVCGDKTRDQKLVCLVSTPQDAAAIERSGYLGLYHILGGALNPRLGITPDKLNFLHLEERLKAEPITEVVLGLNYDIEGEETARYAKTLLGKANIKISRLAQGLPQNSAVEYADANTLATALKHRQELS